MRRLRLFAALLAACFAAWLWLAPGYLEVHVPVEGHGAMEFWQEQHRTRLSDRGLTGVVYVYRQFGSTSDKHAWTSEAEVFSYFEQHLIKLGWAFSVAGIQDRIAPESQFLGKDNHRMYYLPGTRNRARLTLSIWRTYPSSRYFNVAMTTYNESLGRRLGEIIDD